MPAGRDSDSVGLVFVRVGCGLGVLETVMVTLRVMVGAIESVRLPDLVSVNAPNVGVFDPPVSVTLRDPVALRVKFTVIDLDQVKMVESVTVLESVSCNDGERVGTLDRVRVMMCTVGVFVRAPDKEPDRDWVDVASSEGLAVSLPVPIVSDAVIVASSESEAVDDARVVLIDCVAVGSSLKDCVDEFVVRLPTLPSTGDTPTSVITKNSINIQNGAARGCNPAAAFIIRQYSGNDVIAYNKLRQP